MFILEQEQESNDNSENPAVDVEKLFSENGDSPELMLNELSDQDMIIAADKLSNNETLNKLELSGVAIGEEVGQYLADILRNNTALTTIGLSSNTIETAGAQLLVDPFRNSKTLNEIRFMSNEIDDEGVQLLTNALRNNTTMTNLHLRANRVGVKGAQHVADALRNNKTLTELALTNNNIDEATQHVLDTSKKSTELVIAEVDEKNNEKRTKTSDVSQEYDDNFEEDMDNVEKNLPDEELSSRLSNYDEDSREGQFYENKSSQNESSSQPIAENSEYDNVDEEDDGTYQGVPLSEITNVCQQPPTIIDMKDVCERTHTFLIKPFKYTSTDPDAEPQAFYENGTYVDEWDQNYVRLPCSQSYINKNGTQRWSIIQESLIKLQHLAETHMASMDDIKETIEECAGRNYELNCLERLLNEVYTVDERAHFMSIVLSNICTLALNVDKICSRPPPLLRIGSNRTVTMSQKQAASLLSCAFFCLFPRRFNQKVGSEYENYQNPNFNTLFQGGRKGGTTWKLQKLKCVFHYFHRITEKMPNGVISFRRYQLPESCVPKWTESTEPLCKIHVTKNKTIEDMDGLLQVDFANKYIGGGVMNEGCVQEEIRFVICPEMLLSLLLCEVIQPNECIFLIGCERFSSYRGYSTSFQFKDNYIDETPKDSWGRKLCHVVAMDAIAFYNRSSQYTIKNMKRELIKAYTCFRVPAALTDLKAGIATGNWGCGAFNGNKQLKAIIQLIAASQAGRPLVYLTFRDQNLVLSFYKVYKYLLDEKATVKDLCTYLQQYTTLYNKITLFDYIIETPVSSL
ncbi:unnamed protein product [Adineta steineri]|uniref:poly(ADP-ribose) glycohydrolase n=1 Tax=Adineta steineri TaxID=433720 RepID=A0A814MJM3_9BILA|nr:unnamed protein product [Adineta steineri]CAF1079243.1 unnamed protein product [Adineta steineri]